MENLYIQIENNQPINHPATEENLLQAFGSIPSNWSPFKRIKLSDSGVKVGFYQNAVNTYTLSTDNVTWQDSWTAVDMSTDEKNTAKQLMLNNINDIISSSKEAAQKIIADLTDQNQIAVWNTYVNLLNEINLSDPTQISYPKLPLKNSENIYVANVDQNNNWIMKTISG